MAILGGFSTVLQLLVQLSDSIDMQQVLSIILKVLQANYIVSGGQSWRLATQVVEGRGRGKALVHKTVERGMGGSGRAAGEVARRSLRHSQGLDRRGWKDTRGSVRREGVMSDQY